MNSTITIASNLNLAGTRVDLNNYTIIFTGEITINATTSFTGSGNAIIRTNFGNFSKNGNGTDIDGSFADLNNAIANCGCTTLAQAINFALPVELLFFTAKAERNSVLLDWATSSESDNEFFLIEYSTDGIAFREIGTVAGQGDSQIRQSYQFRHVPGSATQHYYRLWQYDLDGTVAELGIVTVKLDGTGQQAEVYPNPVSKTQALRLRNVDAASTLSLVSGNGRQWPLTVSGDDQVVLPTGLATGLYYLRITSGEGERMVPVNVVR